MDQQKRTYFVISQIGDKGTDVRKAADDLYDLVIEQALEKFGFEVRRADKISTVASITSEIVELVQNSDLCVIDITGHSPNVMYECGRRHETGRPYIMLCKNGEKLPFDINTIRTIFYDLSDGREIRNAVRNIQTVVEKMISEGFQRQSSDESLASISDSLKRIERTLNDFQISGSAHSGPSIGLSQSAQDILDKLKPPAAFNYALKQRDVRLAEELIPRLEATAPWDTFVRAFLIRAAAIGSKLAARRIESEVIPNLQSFDVIAVQVS